MNSRFLPATYLCPNSPGSPHTQAIKQQLAICSLALTLFLSSTLAAQESGNGQAVSALGRIEPQGGVTHLAASSTPQSIMGGIVAELHVKEGEEVTKGQLIVTLDTAEVMEAIVVEAEAAVQLALREIEAATSQVEEACVRADVAQREADRRTRLHAKGLAGEEEMESSRGEAEALSASCKATKSVVRSAQARSEVAKADLVKAQAESKRSYLYSPIDGTILDVHAKTGEFIDLEGAVSIGNVKQMVAIAEVYETDIHRVKMGQRATISSAVLSEDLSGTVHFIQHMVAKQDQLGTDPAARKDARIVEVEILLNDSDPVSKLTNMQVDVVIHP